MGCAAAEAVTHLEPATDAGPFDTELLLLLATAYVRDGRFAQARGRLDDAPSRRRNAANCYDCP